MNWLTYDEAENPICNFRPDVLAVVIVYTTDSDTEPVPHVKLRIIFEDGCYSKEFIEPLSKLEEIK